LASVFIWLMLSVTFIYFCSIIFDNPTFYVCNSQMSLINVLWFWDLLKKTPLSRKWSYLLKTNKFDCSYKKAWKPETRWRNKTRKQKEEQEERTLKKKQVEEGKNIIEKETKKQEKTMKRRKKAKHQWSSHVPLT